jgi:hypothetical protein
MRVIATTLATQLNAEKSRDPLVARVLKMLLPAANPELDGAYKWVCLWWIEIDDQGTPQREIGFDSAGSPVVAGPFGPNMGYWTDSPMTFEHGEYEAVSPDSFERVWSSVEAAPPWKSTR